MAKNTYIEIIGYLDIVNSYIVWSLPKRTVTNITNHTVTINNQSYSYYK